MLYFPHRTRPVLVREVRSVSRAGEQPEWVLFRELLRGPESAAARPLPIPPADPGSGRPPLLLGVKVLEGNLLLLLSRQAAEMLARSGTELDVYAIVNTAFTNPRVTAVRLQPETGTGPLTVAGIDITRDLTPRWDLVDPWEDAPAGDRRQGSTRSPSAVRVGLPPNR